jgi:virginiamycin B lyase
MGRSRAAVFASMVAVACGSGASFASTATDPALPRGGQVIAKVRIPAGYGGFAVGEGAIWSITDEASTLIRVDPRGNRAAAKIKVEPRNPCPQYVCGEPAVGAGAVWVPRAPDNTVSRVDVASDAVVATIRVGPQPLAVAVTAGAVWVMNGGGPSVSRIDPSTNRVVATIRLGPARAASDRGFVTGGAGAVWASVPNLKTVVRIDPSTNTIAARIRLSDFPCGMIAADSRAVWVSGAGCSPWVLRIDPRTNRQTGTVKSMRQPVGLGLGFGSLWVADLDAKTIVRVNPRTGSVSGRLPVGGFPVRLAVGFGSVWVRDDTGRVLRIEPLG